MSVFDRGISAEICALSSTSAPLYCALIPFSNKGIRARGHGAFVLLRARLRGRKCSQESEHFLAVYSITSGMPRYSDVNSNLNTFCRLSVVTVIGSIPEVFGSPNLCGIKCTAGGCLPPNCAMNSSYERSPPGISILLKVISYSPGFAPLNPPVATVNLPLASVIPPAECAPSRGLKVMLTPCTGLPSNVIVPST